MAPMSSSKVKQKPYKRPQQPTDSTAASVPTELVSRILTLALADLSPWDAQVLRMSFGGVCTHWYGIAAHSGDEFVVKDSVKAGRLAESLLADTAERQERIKSLIIHVEGKNAGTGAGRGSRTADLLLSCPKLARLHLTITDSLGEKKSRYGTFGKALRDGLAACTTLDSLELHGANWLPGKAFAHIMSHLLELRKFVAPDLHTEGHASYPLVSRKIEELEMRTTIFHSPLALALLQGTSSLTHLRYLSSSRVRLAVEHALRSKSTLVELHIHNWSWNSGPNSWMSEALRQLAALRHLTMGLQGLAWDTLFDHLALLRKLETFKLLPGINATGVFIPDYALITSAAASAFISEAPSLKSIDLSTEVKRGWSTEELATAEQVAQIAGVEMKFSGRS